MNLRVRYRPFSGTLVMMTHVAIDKIRDEGGFKPNTQFLYPNEDKWTVSMTSHEIDGVDTFMGATVLDVKDRGATWTLWLSEWFPDHIIGEIIRLMNEWDQSYLLVRTAETSKENMMVKYEAELALI